MGVLSVRAVHALLRARALAVFDSTVVVGCDKNLVQQ